MMNLTVSLPHQPGTMKRVAESLGSAGINIEGFCDYIVGGVGEVQLVVADAQAARAALEKAGFTVGEAREVQILTVENTPGALAKLLKPIADKGANMLFCYSLHDNRVAVVVE